jgi:hypothetical protein
MRCASPPRARGDGRPPASPTPPSARSLSAPGSNRRHHYAELRRHQRHRRHPRRQRHHLLCGLPIAYHAAKCGIDIDLLTRGAGFGYIGSTITSLIYASFTFIFFALEAVIMAAALEMCFGIPAPDRLSHQRRSSSFRW